MERSAEYAERYSNAGKLPDGALQGLSLESSAHKRVTRRQTRKSCSPPKRVDRQIMVPVSCDRKSRYETVTSDERAAIPELQFLQPSPWSNYHAKGHPRETELLVDPIYRLWTCTRCGFWQWCSLELLPRAAPREAAIVTPVAKTFEDVLSERCA